MELSEIREQLNKIDDSLLSLFLERMELSGQVARYKLEHNMPIVDRAREREIIARLTARAENSERWVHRLYSTIFELSRASQATVSLGETEVAKTIKKAIAEEKTLFPETGLIACQGTEGGNSQMAADHLFPRGSLMYVKNFPAVFEAVECGLCRFGVLPIENSSNGSVRAVYELLQKHNVSIVRSTRLCIRHELLALPGAKLSDVKTVYSHEQALGQCSKFLGGLPGVKVVPCDNTAVAAKLVSESNDKTVAAIASHPCAELYGLTCLSSAIQDSDNNYTRFITIAKGTELYAGSNRISLIISCDNKPGALYDILAKFQALGINMTKLESCPVTGSNFEFIFILDLEASIRVPEVAGMLAELERTTASFRLIGCYSEV
ncbi:MAG: bifunctional chorismate mutase/prephenate dehydratase [Clostridia bacterium]|nr:bifunctional chorismate mutase/prephenate dehydratase [Clostridia bacterium]